MDVRSPTVRGVQNSLPFCRAGRRAKLLDRGRESLRGSPSLRTGLAVLPHPALRLVVFLYLVKD